MPPLQSSVSAGIGVTSTAAEAIRGIDITGTCAIVTGSYSRGSLETAKEFRSVGAKVRQLSEQLTSTRIH
ncbi:MULTISPECIES: hypothetical protein [Burkholderia]|uniref:Uncharacterized protein n=1 Tax=Burkholderia anthina TaxID=179879 RepID=A0A6P2G4A7_9BURK|nr:MULTISPECIES: hypothetical protein [Burkholderia]MBM2766727.1 hypothetical protein [Burkholderia anthina]VVU48562.1 hypothetical protein BAN20980_01261 [Burkholderia anthina]